MTVALAVDAGTTGMKAALVRDGREVISQHELSYPLNLRGAEIDQDPQYWWDGFFECCAHLGPQRSEAQAIGFSVSTPGAMAFDRDGNPLTPAVLFMDGRSGAQAQMVRDVIGEAYLLEHTSNLPVSGGCTASTMMWWKEKQPDVFREAAMFGHTNTFLCKRLTGEWGMDPSTASLTALYNTTQNDKTWNASIAEPLGVPLEKLPPIVDSWAPVGELLPQWAENAGLRAGVSVLMGGNDAMCAALTGGVTCEGAVLDICGTCEIICVGLAKSLPGRHYNVRCHVVPGLWSTLYVLNTGGKALEWFQQMFCREMSADEFYQSFVPQAIESYFAAGRTWELPDYEVYLAGDRYSTQPRHAAFSKLQLHTSREMMLMAMIRGNNQYMARHLDEMAQHVTLSRDVHLTGGGLSQDFIRCKREWMGEYEYRLRENSSMMGAAQLAHYAVSGEAVWENETSESS